MVCFLHKTKIPTHERKKNCRVKKKWGQNDPYSLIFLGLGWPWVFWGVHNNIHRVHAFPTQQYLVNGITPLTNTTRELSGAGCFGLSPLPSYTRARRGARVIACFPSFSCLSASQQAVGKNGWDNFLFPFFFFFFFHPIYYLRPSFYLSLLVVTRVRGNTAASSRPSPVRNLVPRIFIAGIFQLLPRRLASNCAYPR